MTLQLYTGTRTINYFFRHSCLDRLNSYNWNVNPCQWTGRSKSRKKTKSSDWSRM